MKPFHAGILCLFITIYASCSSSGLSREKAFAIIQKEMGYPKVSDWEIFTGDPKHAQKFLEAGLEQQGYGVVRKTERLMDMGKPYITLTEKSKEFWLPTKEEDKKYAIQLVRIAEETLVAVTGVKMLSSGKKAIVEYTTEFKKVTPFAALLPVPVTPDKANANKAYFSLYDDGWRLEQKPDMDFMVE